MKLLQVQVIVRASSFPWISASTIRKTTFATATFIASSELQTPAETFPTIAPKKPSEDDSSNEDRVEETKWALLSKNKYFCIKT
mmetsp:Transcript_12089/g.24942  ORF Transcript_12089/g.24942 Transcript_12089/m.24942 type:complete len:84 (+) Transcript_12089:252-503(+)